MPLDDYCGAICWFNVKAIISQNREGKYKLICVMSATIHKR